MTAKATPSQTTARIAGGVPAGCTRGSPAGGNAGVRSRLLGHPLTGPAIEISAGTSSVRTTKASISKPAAHRERELAERPDRHDRQHREAEREHDAGDRDR